jgi:DNA mismatch repair protein MutH
VTTEAALLTLARSFAGRSVSSLLASSSEPTLLLHKGGVGQVIERALGVVGAATGPDFAQLGVEVKTLPVHNGRVTESTYVCMASPERAQQETWLTSWVRSKIARVLFVPVESDREVPLDARRVGTAFLWSPSDDDERVLRADWEDLSDLVARGLGFAVTARRGRVLQLRPKAPDARTFRTIDVDGESVRVRPQGFYLRTRFTQAIVERTFGG